MQTSYAEISKVLLSDFRRTIIVCPAPEGHTRVIVGDLTVDVPETESVGSIRSTMLAVAKFYSSTIKSGPYYRKVTL